MQTPPSPGGATSDLEAPSSPADKPKGWKQGSRDRGREPRGAAGAGASSKDPAQGNIVTGKIKHLKKEDGEPLWRKDIQYDFLKHIFDDETNVFTNSYDENLPRQNFADLYIDTMSRSSKTSKILRDKLLTDRDAAKGMAMVCLLVNMGRMNTTLNFFPEMRAQLRTYHAIPSLQAHQDPHAYKQLQDAPRLKSILKGGSEDRPEPTGLEKIRRIDFAPRTNPVNLIFIICQTAAKVADLHFPPGQEFHDLIMKTQYTSKSRAVAFLWLMWFYLESDFTQEGCEENPFGPGVDYGQDVANQGVPKLDVMTEEEEAIENLDTEEEKVFGREKQQMRTKILEAEQQYMADRDNKRGSRAKPFPEEGPAILPRIRPGKNESDMDSTRSTPPPKGNIARSAIAGAASSNRRSAGGALKFAAADPSSPAEPSNHRGQLIDGIMARKPRPPTAHQLAVERNRAQRVEYILDRDLRIQHHKSRKLRRMDGAIYRALMRQHVSNPLEDSEDEDCKPTNLRQKSGQLFRERGVGGLCLLITEADDYGEQASSYAAAIRRSVRRLARWGNHKGQPLGVISTTKRLKIEDDDYGDDTMIGLGRSERSKSGGDMNGDTMMDDADDLDDMDRTMNGLDDMDDVDRTELAMADVDSDMD